MDVVNGCADGSIREGFFLWGVENVGVQDDLFVSVVGAGVV